MVYVFCVVMIFCAESRKAVCSSRGWGFTEHVVLVWCICSWAFVMAAAAAGAQLYLCAWVGVWVEGGVVVCVAATCGYC